MSGKVPTKTAGKVEVFPAQAGMSRPQCLNESPSKKEGKPLFTLSRPTGTIRLNESPSK